MELGTMLPETAMTMDCRTLRPPRVGLRAVILKTAMTMECRMLRHLRTPMKMDYRILRTPPVGLRGGNSQEANDDGVVGEEGKN